MKRPRISIITVAYRSTAALERCVAALARASTSPDLLEMIVVDNGNEADLAPRLHRILPSATVITMPSNVGFGAACNTGARRARGARLAFVNPDAEVLPGALDELADFLDAHPGVNCVGPRLLNSDGTLQPSGYRFPDLGTETARLSGIAALIPRRLIRRNAWLRRLLPKRGHFDPHTEAREVDYVTGACMLLDRDAFTAAGGFDEQFFLYYEEIDLAHRLNGAGGGSWHVPRAAAVHHLGVAAAQAPTNAWLHRHRSRLLYFRRYASGPEVVALRLVMTVNLLVGLPLAMARALWRRSTAPLAAHGQVLRWCILGGPDDARSQRRSRRRS